MKNSNTLLTACLIGLCFFAFESYGQGDYDMNSKSDRSDSLQNEKYLLQAQQQTDKNKMEDVKDADKSAKAKAKEAKRVQIEADTAAREARSALKAEKKAQKARRNADKQAKKAVQARDKSDQN